MQFITASTRLKVAIPLYNLIHSRLFSWYNHVEVWTKSTESLDKFIWVDHFRKKLRLFHIFLPKSRLKLHFYILVFVVFYSLMIFESKLKSEGLFMNACCKKVIIDHTQKISFSLKKIVLFFYYLYFKQTLL